MTIFPVKLHKYNAFFTEAKTRFWNLLVALLSSYILLFLGYLNCYVFLVVILFTEEVSSCLTKYWIKYTYNPSCTVSLA